MQTTKRLREGFSIGQTARRTGVKLETIRYYERIGMLADPPRTATGHRVYGADDVRAIAFIHRGRELDFPLADIRALLAMRVAGPVCCADAHEIAMHHLECMRAKIANLSHLARLLEQAIDQCSVSEHRCCPVMDLLEGAPDKAAAGAT